MMQFLPVAEYDGDGILTCLEIYDGKVYVGCEEGPAPLYTVDAETGFTPVPLPDGPPGSTNVQALLAAGSVLWAFGWVKRLPWGGTSGVHYKADATVWRYDGSTWVRYASKPQVSGTLRWCQPVPDSDGTIACGWWRQAGGAAGFGAGIGFRGWVRDYRLVVANEMSDWMVDLRAQSRLGGRVLRVVLVGGQGWFFEDDPVREWRVHDGDTSPGWGLAWNTLLLITTWQDRVWATQLLTDRNLGLITSQRLIATRLGTEFVEGPMWTVGTLGQYDVLLPFRGRLLMFGTLSGHEGCMAVWDPPDMRLALPLSWRVRHAVADGWRLWALGTIGTMGYWLSGGGYVPVGEFRQAVLVALGRVGVDVLTVEWADGSGTHKPTVDRLAVEWSRMYPTVLAVDALTVEWADGSGTHKPTVDRLMLQYSDGHSVNRPVVDLVQLVWGKGLDHRPVLDLLTVEWGDGSGTHKPAVDVLTVAWNAGALGRPQLDRVTLEWGDGSGTHKPAVDALTLEFSDGTGAKPAVDLVTLHYSIGGLGYRPAVDKLETQWADYPAGPPPSRVKVNLLRFEWNDDSDPVEETDEVLWLTYTAAAPVAGVRVVTSFALPEDGQLQCLVRADQEHLPVDAWHTYQRGQTNRRIMLEEPGTVLRVGVVKPAELPDNTDVFVQLHYEE
ncbi:MAG: hypothetical protein AB7Y46_08695 [Armatimonadota bacterium]